MHFVSACFDNIKKVKLKAQYIWYMYFMAFEAKCWEGTLEGQFGIDVRKPIDIIDKFEG